MLFMLKLLGKKLSVIDVRIVFPVFFVIGLSTNLNSYRLCVRKFPFVSVSSKEAVPDAENQ